MNYFLPLFFGFMTSFLGMLPPGLINMTAAKVSHKEGKKNALWFIFGAILILCAQVFFALFFAEIINRRPDLVILLREIGCGVFAILTIYFLGFAKKPKAKSQKIKSKSGTNRFFQGMFLSALNFFPIPYFAFVSIALASYNLFTYDATSVFTYIVGMSIGAFLDFYIYIVFFDKIKSKKEYIMQNMNAIIGIITGLISVFALINIIEYYW